MLKNKLTVYTISEFGLIGVDDAVINYNKYLSAKIDILAYKDLECFAKSEKGRDVLQFTANGKYLQAKNYIGIIQTKSNYVLEILPKTVPNNDENNIIRAKSLFMKLLHLLHKLPSNRNTEFANIEKIRNVDIFEIFINMFLDEVGAVIQKGLKSGYVLQEENLNFLKGKLLHHNNIKHNSVNKHKFYVQYDEFSQNRPENKLIKSTLLLLLGYSQDYNNLRRIRMYIEHMNLVSPSQNIDHDLRSIHISRGMEHYNYALLWARVFLKKESFSSFSGKNIALAILYPMEKLFECFVDWWLKKHYPQFTIKSQVGGYSFVKGLFSLRPDFIIQSEKNIIAIADAKWKLINCDNDISQGDFYQLFAYKQVCLSKLNNNFTNPLIPPLQIIYPKSDYLSNSKSFQFFDGNSITITPLDIEEEVMSYH